MASATLTACCALRMAREALETALEFYFDEGRAVPSPSQAKRGQRVVELAASVTTIEIRAV